MNDIANRLAEFWITVEDTAKKELPRNQGIVDGYEVNYCPTEFFFECTRDKIDYTKALLDFYVHREDKPLMTVLSFEIDDFSPIFMRNVLGDFYPNTDFQVTTPTSIAMKLDILDLFNDIPDLTLVLLF